MRENMNFFIDCYFYGKEIWTDKSDSIITYNNVEIHHDKQ